LNRGLPTRRNKGADKDMVNYRKGLVDAWAERLDRDWCWWGTFTFRGNVHPHLGKKPKPGEVPLKMFAKVRYREYNISHMNGLTNGSGAAFGV